jgi:hypothetical protein
MILIDDFSVNFFLEYQTVDKGVFIKNFLVVFLFHLHILFIEVLLIFVEFLHDKVLAI